MGSEIKIDFMALDCASPVLDDSVPVSGNEHNGAEREVAGIRCNRSGSNAGAAGRDPDIFALSLHGSIGEYWSPEPVPVPTTATTAMAVPCHLHGHDARVAIQNAARGRPSYIPGGTSRQRYTQHTKQKPRPVRALHDRSIPFCVLHIFTSCTSRPQLQA